MPADEHPIEALENRFRTEDAFVSPVAEVLLDIASRLPLPWPLDKAIGKVRERLAADSVERIRLVLEICATEVRKHGDLLREALGPEETQRRAETAKELVLDCARKAEVTRSQERVKRIGLILANAMIEPQPTDADEVEEMMLVAMEMSDRDVAYLRELIRIEGHMLQTRNHIDRNSGHVTWESGFWGTRGDSELDSVFSKLESFGLVTRIAPPNNLNITADFQNRYVLLKKGVRFAHLINQAADAQTTH